MPPPRWIRRVFLAPLVLLLTIGALITLPFWLLVAAIASRWMPGRWRPLRLLWFASIYAAVEAAALLATFGLWVGSGFGRRLDSPGSIDRHYKLLGWALGRIVGAAERVFGLSLEPLQIPASSDPQIMLARHAGPGDSFLLVNDTLARNQRPRIVMRETLQWDPLIDVLLGRLPCRFVPAPARAEAGSGVVAGIADLARTMGADDTLIIFPEGGNLTEARRLRSIVRLEEDGHREAAERARRMRHVMAPKPGGALAAMAGCPRAEVVFVAHTGLEDLSTPVDLWRGLPMDSTVHAAAWVCRPDQVPVGDRERVDWLYGWWETIDRWIGDARHDLSTPSPPDRLDGTPHIDSSPTFASRGRTPRSCPAGWESPPSGAG